MSHTSLPEIVHICDEPNKETVRSYAQTGLGNGSRVLIVGEAPAPNGWRLSGRAFYTPKGKLLPTGSRLNALLNGFNHSVETCAFTELVKCFIGAERSLLYSCAKKTWPIFIEQVSDADASLLLILGKKTHETFEKCFGQKLEIGKLEKLDIAGKQRFYLSIYHPSPISPTSQKRNMEIFKSQSENLKKILNEPY